MTSAMVVTAAMLLAGCGGGSGQSGTPVNGNGSATVGGSVSGVPTATTLLMVNKGVDIINVTGNGNFTFDSQLQAGTQYNVTLFTQPTGYVCSIANGQGTVDSNADAVTNIAVSCQSAAVAMPEYNVGAKVSGLSSKNSLTLQLYGSNPLTVNADGLVVFPQTLSPDTVTPPGPVVTVGTNPTGQSCTVASNGTGSSINFVLVDVTCQ